MQNKKGLSDVVTTVLIILLAVAAVSAIWLLIKPLLESSGNTIQKSQICLSNQVDVVSCSAQKNADNTIDNHTIAYKISSVDTNQVKSISKVYIGVIYEDGTVANNATTIPSSLQVGALITAKVYDDKKAKKITLVTDYLTSGDQVQSCTSSELTCTN